VTQILARGRSYLKLSWVAIVSIVISRLPIVNTRAFSFPRNYPSRRLLARIPRKWTYNLPHAHSRSPFPFIVVLYHENSYGIDAGVTRTIPLPYLGPSYSPETRAVCDSPLPRGANYIVRNVNLVCQAVSAREGSLTSLDGTCTSLAITAPRDEEISSYSWEHIPPLTLSVLSTNTRSIRV